MEAESVLQLLDSYWYDLDFFKRSKPNQIQRNPQITTTNSSTDIPTLPTIHTKSPFEQISSTSKVCISSTPSPDSVLFALKLQTIFSGKESADFDTQDHEQQQTPKMVTSLATPTKGNVGILRRKKKGLSKSLSDLEFEELKGFMDLGFVFSEEDKDSSLATIIPGLQRLGDNLSKNNDDMNSKVNGINTPETKFFGSATGNTVARPYLSEAWKVLEKKKKKEDSLMKWKVPAHNSQIDMKDYLKSWAHTVASTVRG